MGANTLLTHGSTKEIGMITGDFHVHTNFSGDSDTPMEEMIKRAIKIGLTKICFTDHMDYNYPKKYPMDFTLDVKGYLDTITDMAKQYKDHIKIYKGIELGLTPENGAWYRELLGRYSFDFIIGSSHVVDNLDPYYPEYWEDTEEEEGYRRYFQTILDNMKAFHDFDSYGHIDYIVRYGPNKNQNYTYEKYADLIDEILITLINKEKALEINTSGYKYGLAQSHPHKDIIKRYKELGGEYITIGSDAHRKEHLAYDFRKAEDMLISLGFEYYTIFDKRIPKLVKIQ